MRKVVIIYRDQLLGPSETFIQAQGEELRSYLPFYVGIKRVSGIVLPSERVFVLDCGSRMGRAREIAFKAIGWAPSMARSIKSSHPSLLHAHFGFDAANILPIADRLQLPLVVTYHGWDATSSEEHLRRSRWGRRYLRRKDRLKQRCSQFLAVSEYIRRCLISQGFPNEKICVHHIGIDTERFTPEHGIERKPIVLFVGRLVEKKGCEFLIRAMQDVQQAVPQSELVVIGDGTLRANVERQASGTLRNCQFLGLQTPEQIRSWMNRATVFCTPSITAESGDAEGFGMVFIEAQAMGLPVASFKSGGVSEAVADGETGLLAAEKDWRTLARNIITLLTDTLAWERMSRAGQQRVRERFDLRKQCAKLERIYADVVADGHA
jgi:colanic acid/amylovoran biosynthesis glycosyltransferase